MKVVALFAGIGGIELGLRRAGHHPILVSEIDPFASAVLDDRFSDAKNVGDIASLKALPRCELLTAGFPCQDLSQAGSVSGIHGSKSRLVRRALDLVENSKHKPDWLLIENVPFMLSLHKGAGMSWLTRRLERLGYSWAYRVIDSRAFGLAQRRRRLFILASRVADPASVLFADPGASREPAATPTTPHGFYWTEGNRGVGWAPDAIPPLKCSSGVGIVSPPAVWIPDKRTVVTPTIEDAEALQGFPRGWTLSASNLKRGERARWRLVGNAVSAPIAEWIGKQLSRDHRNRVVEQVKLTAQNGWPRAGCGAEGTRYQVSVSEWPTRTVQRGILDFLSPEAPLLSQRATSGFLKRLLQSNLRVPEQFVDDLKYHISNGPTYADHGPSNQRSDVPHARAGQFA